MKTIYLVYMSKNGNRVVLRAFTDRGHAKSYCKLYENLIDDKTYYVEEVILDTTELEY